MNNQNNENKWLEDFKDFVACETTSVPIEISDKIVNSVFRDLNPSPWLVFAKLFGLQSVAGIISLAICNQFGLNPFQTHFSLSHYFMKFGNSTCMFLCGFIFLGIGVSVGNAILRLEELRVLQKHFGLQIFALSLFSLGIFSIVGAEITLVIGSLWLLGALIGGTFSIFISRLYHHH